MVFAKETIQGDSYFVEYSNYFEKIRAYQS